MTFAAFATAKMIENHFAAQAALLDKTETRLRDCMHNQKIGGNHGYRSSSARLPALALGLLGVVPAFAGADEDAVREKPRGVPRGAGGRQCRRARLALRGRSQLQPLGAARSTTRRRFWTASPTRTTNGRSLEYKNPTVRVVGPAAIVRFNFVGEQEFTDGKKTPQNLAHPDELAEAGHRLEAAVPRGDQALIS